MNATPSAADQPEQGTREAALWLAAMADRAAKGALNDPTIIDADPTLALFKTLGGHAYLTGAQVHALLYIGDQVKALVEAVTPPRLVQLDPDVQIDVNDLAADMAKAGRLHTMPMRTTITDPTPSVSDIRAVIDRQQELHDGLHPSRCRCDWICRAITEAAARR